MTNKEETVTTTDRDGNEFETPLGVDGVNPVSVNNPPAKAITTEDADVVKEEQEKEAQRYEDGVGEGSDGPGNEHNAENGTASAADLRAGRARPTTSAEVGAPTDGVSEKAGAESERMSETGTQEDQANDTADEDKAPAKSASKADWVEYATTKKGMSEDEANAKTRDELAEMYS